ncbi:hypothetical protein AB0H63_20060 [Micromonospora echinospora]|uniref:hypothetical protein n=1 Tax=Micromonospora echinospora TaxID=1877 RepID=UPI0033DE1C8D
MTRALPAITAAALLCAVLAGCGSDTTDQPTTAPASASATGDPFGCPDWPVCPTLPASSATDKDRRGCRSVAELADHLEFDPTANRNAGALAAEASVPGISQAGVQLVTVANKARANPGPNANLNIREAQRNVAEACAAAFGDGPW